MDDGLLSFTVIERGENEVKCIVDNSGTHCSFSFLFPFFPFFYYLICVYISLLFVQIQSSRFFIKQNGHTYIFHLQCFYIGVLGQDKGINFPSHIIDDLPVISEADKKHIQFAIDNKFDFISVSCIRNIEDVEEVRLLLGNAKIKLLCKIENQRGMDNFESILKRADGIVIDRGYLGAEVDVEVVTMAQKVNYNLIYISIFICPTFLKLVLM